MKQFKANVPADIIAKLSSLSDMIDLSELMGRSVESVTEQRIEEIQGNYVSGWMPSQDGGFSVDQFWDNGTDAWLTENQRDYNGEQWKDCFKMYQSDVLDRDCEYDDMSDEEREEFYDYEREWFEPCLVQCQMFIDGFSESMFGRNDKQVTIRLSVNYKDAPYYREKYSEDIKTVILEIDEFMNLSNEEIIAQLKGE